MLNNGWIVSNILGLVVLQNIFVLVHVIAALMSFGIFAPLPHHLPRSVGFTAANRVDMEGFYRQATWEPAGKLAGPAPQAIGEGGRQLAKSMQRLREGSAGYISGPEARETSIAEDAMDADVAGENNV